MNPPVAVVGAGIVGICSALYLQQLGRRVMLIDRLAPGDPGAASFGNAGSLAWSACVPIAVPGLLREVPGWLLRRDGPLSVRWRYLPRLAPWLWRFVRAGASEQRVAAAADALAALHAPSLALHRQLAAAAGVGGLIRGCDYLHVYRHVRPGRLDELGWRLRRERGARLSLLGGAALREREPALSPDYRQAVLVHEQGFIANPSRLLSALAAYFQQQGGELRRAEVRDLHADGAELRALQTDAGEILVDALVIAAGAWSTRLTRRLGVELPLETERGYHVTLAEPGVSLNATVMETDAKFVATPMETGLRLAGTVELASLDAAPDYRRAETILRHGRRMLPGLRAKPLTRWMGRRPSLPDGLPVIGPAPGYRNVFLAFGHAHTGMIAAPNTGRLIAGMVCGRPLNIDTGPFRAGRFAPDGSA